MTPRMFIVKLDMGNVFLFRQRGRWFVHGPVGLLDDDLLGLIERNLLRLARTLYGTRHCEDTDIDIELPDGHWVRRIRPMTMHEIIRAGGSSVEIDLGPRVRRIGKDRAAYSNADALLDRQMNQNTLKAPGRASVRKNARNRQGDENEVVR